MRDEKPSATALLIARSQLLLATSASIGVLIGAERAAYYRAFTEAAKGAEWRLNPARRWWFAAMERISVPGIYLHYTLRKKCIEALVDGFLNSAQIEQVVMIAGGFDPLLAILARKFDSAVFLELDHPATQQVKRAALRKVGGADNLILIPVDLTKQSIGQALLGTVFSASKPTLFIAEGITMYLDEDELTGLLREVRVHADHPDSHILFTFMNKQPSGSIQFESATCLVNWWLRLKREVFKWGIETNELARFLAGVGYRLLSILDADDLAAPYRQAISQLKTPPARGEAVCLAKVM
jgi:methyltransferase (TIGR00027 family)